jgi:hypothetical protein
VLHGAAGIGKTSIAEMFKHFVKNRQRFPDGIFTVILVYGLGHSCSEADGVTSLAGFVPTPPLERASQH